MKHSIIVSVLSCMIFGQALAIEYIPSPTFGQHMSFSMENTKDLAELYPNRAKALLVAVAAGAGYLFASYFDRLPAAVPSVSKIKGEIKKAVPAQTPAVIVAECVLGLAAAYLLQDVPVFAASLFANPYPDGV